MRPQVKRLAFFLRTRAPGVVTYREITAELWPEHPPADPANNIKVAMCRARHLLPAWEITNLRGKGYRMEAVE